MKQKKAHASHPIGNRTVIGVICIVVALTICFGIAPLVNRLSDGKTKIVRLTRDISAGATITEADIEVVDVGSYNLPTGVIKDKAQVVGKCALSNLTKGDYLFPSKIGNDTNNAGRMLESLDENHKAISITIGSFALGFSGKLETGDIVGILVYDQVENRSYTPKELTYVKVITTTTSSGVDKADVEDKSQPITVTLLVNDEQAELLALLDHLPAFVTPSICFLNQKIGRKTGIYNPRFHFVIAILQAFCGLGKVLCFFNNTCINSALCIALVDIAITATVATLFATFPRIPHCHILTSPDSYR